MLKAPNPNDYPDRSEQHLEFSNNDDAAGDMDESDTSKSSGSSQSRTHGTQDRSHGRSGRGSPDRNASLDDYYGHEAYNLPNATLNPWENEANFLNNSHGAGSARHDSRHGRKSRKHSRRDDSRGSRGKVSKYTDYGNVDHTGRRARKPAVARGLLDDSDGTDGSDYDMDDELEELRLQREASKKKSCCFNFFQRLVLICIFVVGIVFGVFITIAIIQNSSDDGFIANIFHHDGSSSGATGKQAETFTIDPVEKAALPTQSPLTALEIYQKQRGIVAKPADAVSSVGTVATNPPTGRPSDRPSERPTERPSRQDTPAPSVKPSERPTEPSAADALEAGETGDKDETVILEQNENVGDTADAAQAKDGTEGTDAADATEPSETTESTAGTSTESTEATDGAAATGTSEATETTEETDEKEDDATGAVATDAASDAEGEVEPDAGKAVESEGEAEMKKQEDGNATKTGTEAETVLIEDPYIVTYEKGEFGVDECQFLTKSKTECSLDNLDSLANSVLPLPYDRPVHASLYCTQNQCKNSPILPEHKVVSSESGDGNEFMLEVDQSVDARCHDTNKDIFDNEDGGIKVSHLNYGNNEDWVYCVRVVNDNGLNDDTFVYPTVRIDFELSHLDLEQGFDNLFLSFQQDYRYDDYVYVWSGNDTKIHSYKHDSRLQANTTDGVYLDTIIFWNTKPHHLSFTEVCLNFQSDDTVTRSGFEGVFKIRHEMGLWTPWSKCKIKGERSLGDEKCGVGVTTRTQSCPASATSPTSAHEVNNATHACLNNYKLDPPEFCLVAPCENVDNMNEEVADHAFGKYWKGMSPDGMANDAAQREVLLYHYNGRTRYDPAHAEFANPFDLYPNLNQTRIDLTRLRSILESERDAILSRYQGETMTHNLADSFHFERGEQRQQLGLRLLSSLLLGKKFTYVATGSSNTAGHDNLWLNAYPMQLQTYMQDVWHRAGVRGASFRVRDAAIGGHVGTHKLGTCITALIDNHDRKIDLITWESMMNDNSKIKPHFEEIWLRNVLGLSEDLEVVRNRSEAVLKQTGAKGLITTQYRSHVMPFVGAVSTSTSPTSAMSLMGRAFFNSFMKYYYDRAGVVNVWGGHPCQLNGLPKNITNNKLYETCRKSNSRWHPSAHRHRVIAEVYAYSMIAAVLERLDAMEADIKDAVEPTGMRPNYKLACLLDQGDAYWKQKKNETEILTYTSVFKRPLPTPKSDTLEMKYVSSSWFCATSFFPAPDHSKLHHFIASSKGFRNVDTEDTPVSPMIFRNGGRMAIDHKAQWRADVNDIGAYMEVWVKVMTHWIQIPYVMGQSTVNAAKYYSRFKITANGTEVGCLNRAGYIEDYVTPANISDFYDLKGGITCLIDVGKPGKYLVKLEYLGNEVEEGAKPAKPMPVLIDMIVGM